MHAQMLLDALLGSPARTSLMRAWPDRLLMKITSSTVTLNCVPESSTCGSYTKKLVAPTSWHVCCSTAAQGVATLERVR